MATANQGNARLAASALTIALFALANVATAQRFGLGPPVAPQMSRQIQLREASNATLSHLERAEEFLQAQQWD